MMSQPTKTSFRQSAAIVSACSICGTANGHDAGFCRCCGVSITRTSAFTAPTGDTAMCDACERPHLLPARFCDQCGDRLPGYARPPAASDDAGLDASTGIAPDCMAVAATPPAPNDTARSGRRNTAAYYLLLPAALAITVMTSLYFSGYRVTRIGVLGNAPTQAAAASPAALLLPVRPMPQAAVSAEPAASPMPPAEVATAPSANDAGRRIVEEATSLSTGEENQEAAPDAAANRAQLAAMTATPAARHGAPQSRHW